MNSRIELSKAEEEGTLPPGWRQYFDPNRKRYFYHNSATQKSTWRRPNKRQHASTQENIATSSSSLWTRCYSPEHNRYFYHNPITNQSKWKPPPTSPNSASTAISFSTTEESKLLLAFDEEKEEKREYEFNLRLQRAKLLVEQCKQATVDMEQAKQVVMAERMDRRDLELARLWRLIAFFCSLHALAVIVALAALITR